MISTHDKADVVATSKQAALVEPGDVAGNSGTSATMSVGDTFDGQISNGTDRDWVRIDLTGGQNYVFSAWGTNGTRGLSDTVVTLYDAEGNQVGRNDDLSSTIRASGLEITAPTSGTYYIEVTGFGTRTGDYTLQAATDVYTPEQIATYLTEVDWGFTFPLRLDAQAGGTLTYNVSNLTGQGQQLADWALESWSIATGINFVQTNSGAANILFDDSQSGAFAGPSSINPTTGVATQSTVNVGTDWLQLYGTTIDSYSFSTYVHEIGHALGLGHGGPYDGSANYGTSNLYANDSLQMTIMSYFTPAENTTIVGSNVEYISPMMADLLAVEMLYGSTQANQGNTVWGANSNIGGWFGALLGILFDGDAAPSNFYSGGPVSFTIHDTGGTDTIDVSTVGVDQRIDMRSERFSDIDGLINNVAIAVDTVIENAIGGGGDDHIRGNDANNRMEGNAGNDTLNGGEGTDTAVLDVASGSVTVSTVGASSIQIVSALGTDLYHNIEFFNFSDGSISAADLLNGGSVGGGGGGGGGGSNTPTPGNDSLTGTNGNDQIAAQAGDDTINAGGGDDQIAGSDGNDRISAGSGNDNIGGGQGDDTISGGTGNDTVGGGDDDDIVIGGDGDDRLYGGSGQDSITGDDGDDDIGTSYGADTLSGGIGNDSMGGGAGNDFINADEGNDEVGGGPGRDTINGGSGNDFLAGGSFDDLINGGTGSDKINAGSGSDTITGGGGADTFVFREFFNGDADVVTDFENGIDKLLISGVDRAPGSGLQGFLDELNITNVAGGVQMAYNGNTITLEGMSAGQLGVEDFIFV
ncbi:MAG: M10 family metallopeptidase C-terminal domain-containing protein [Roseovarius sp.]